MWYAVEPLAKSVSVAPTRKLLSTFFVPSYDLSLPLSSGIIDAVLALSRKTFCLILQKAL